MTRMTVTAFDGPTKLGEFMLDNDRERGPRNVQLLVEERFPNANRIHMTGRNGYLLFEEYVLRDGAWFDPHSPLSRAAALFAPGSLMNLLILSLRGRR